MRLILLTLVLLLLITSRAYAKEEPMQLIIEADKNEYKAGDKITFTATFKNNSDKKYLIIWTDGVPFIHVGNWKGKAGDPYDASLGLLDDEANTPPWERISLKSKESFTKKITISSDKFFPAGKYNLTYQYTQPNWFGNIMTAADQELWSEKLTSNSITVQISK